MNPRHSSSVARVLVAGSVLCAGPACELLIGADFSEPEPLDPSPVTPTNSPTGKMPPDDGPPEMPDRTEDAGGNAVCPAGEMRCDGAVPQLCKPKGEGWRSLTACASAELCVLGEDKLAQCLPPPCYEGQLRCNGAALETCRAGDYSWERLDTCATEAHCSTTLGACAPSVCEAGAVRCSGQVLEVCREASGQWEADTQCGVYDLCDDVARDCLPCESGASHCIGQRLLRCGETGVWTLQEDCDDQCHPAGCREVNCLEGEYMCTVEGGLRECDSEMDAFIPSRDCDAPAACDAALGDCRTCDSLSGLYCSTLPACPAALTLKHAGLCVQASGMEPGTAVAQSKCAANPAQSFRLESATPGGYRVVATASDLCFSLEAASGEDGTNIVLAACSEEAGQIFSLKEFDSGFELRGGPRQKCIQSAGTEEGVPLHLDVCGSNSRFAFSFEECL